MKNRQTAKERGLIRDFERERHARITAEVRLHAAATFVSSDAVAITYQTLGQYREALMKLLMVGP